MAAMHLNIHSMYANKSVLPHSAFPSATISRMKPNHDADPRSAVNALLHVHTKTSK